MKNLILLLCAAGLLVAQDKPAEPERVELTGPDALRVLLFHYRATLVQMELQRLNAQIQSSLKAACEAKKMFPCKVVAIGEETLTVERETTPRPGGTPK